MNRIATTIRLQEGEDPAPLRRKIIVRAEPTLRVTKHNQFIGLGLYERNRAKLRIFNLHLLL
jgi:hypothetical protein